MEANRATRGPWDQYLDEGNVCKDLRVLWTPQVLSRVIVKLNKSTLKEDTLLHITKKQCNSFLK